MASHRGVALKRVKKARSGLPLLLRGRIRTTSVSKQELLWAAKLDKELRVLKQMHFSTFKNPRTEMERRWDSFGRRTYEALLQQFLNENLQQFSRKSKKARLQALEVTALLVKTYTDFYGATQFVVPQEFVKSMQEKMGLREIGGVCDYKIVQKPRQKIVILEPKHVEDLEVTYRDYLHQEIHLDEPRTKTSPVLLHVHPKALRPAMRVHEGDRISTRNFKPCVVFSKEGNWVVILFPNLVEVARRKDQFSNFAYVKVLPEKKIGKIVKAAR